MEFNVVTILLAIVGIILGGGVVYYLNALKTLKKETVELIQVVLESLKDKKLTIAEKEAIVKEYLDVKPAFKALKDKFLEDFKSMVEDPDSIYNKLKAKIKK
jgi:hypothetical protein